MRETKSAYTLRMRASTQRTTAHHDDVVVYRWGRIVGALVVALLVVATLGFLIWSWLGAPDGSENEPRLVAAGKIITDPAETAPPASSEPPATIALVKPEKTDTGAEPSDPTPADTTSPAEPLPQASGASGPAGDRAPETTEEPPAFVVDDPADRPEPADEPPLSAQNPGTPDEPAQTEAAPVVSKTPSGEATVEIASDHLVRAQLTPALESREPTTALPADVRMDSDDLIKVYFFTELEGLKGHTVFYNWYLADKRMAQVPVRVHLDRMRASTSKNINRSMLGQWRVEAVTGDGDLLGSGRFTVIE